MRLIDEGSSELCILALQNVAKAQAMQKYMEQFSQNEEDALQTSFDADHLASALYFQEFKTEIISFLCAGDRLNNAA